MNKSLLLLILGVLLVGCQDPASEIVNDQTPPVILFESPQDSALVNGTVTISVTANDNQGVTAVELFLDGAPIGGVLTSIPFSYQWDTRELSDYTWHTLTASATDAAGNTGFADTLDVLVDNSVTGDSAGLALYEPEGLGKYAVTLFWEPADTADFISYELYRNQGPLVTDADTKVTTLADRGETRFTDTALNRATQYAYRLYHTDSTGTYASNLVRFTTPDISPSDVTKTTLISESQVDVAWKKSTEPDFARYRLRREENTPVTDNSLIVAEFSNINKRSHSDTTVRSHIQYFYRIDVVDSRENFRSGKQDSIITDVPPDPVTIRIDSFSQEEVRIAWTASLITDFKQYELYSNTDPKIPRDGIPVGVITNQTDTTYAHRDIGTGVTYFYRLFVVDQLDQAAGSNEVSVTIDP